MRLKPVTRICSPPHPPPPPTHTHSWKKLSTKKLESGAPNNRSRGLQLGSLWLVFTYCNVLNSPRLYSCVNCINLNKNMGYLCILSNWLLEHIKWQRRNLSKTYFYLHNFNYAVNAGVSKSPWNTNLTNSQPFYTLGCLPLVQPFLKYKNGRTPDWLVGRNDGKNTFQDLINLVLRCLVWHHNKNLLLW